MSPRRLPVALAVLAALAPGPARGADNGPPLRPLRFAESGPNLVVSGTFTDVFDRELLEQLSSGFVTTVVLRTYLYQSGQDKPVWVTAATYRVSYDIWDEVYDVRINDITGEHDLPKRKTVADALKDVTTMNNLVVAPLSAVRIGSPYFVDVLVEVNPVSPELLAEVRRWLARPQGDQVGNAAFFGSFVSVFVNPKVEEADRILRFRSPLPPRIPRANP
jgi:uncharacterized protein DUF4390